MNRPALILVALSLWFGGLVVTLDERYPPNLMRYQDLSTLVVDRDGRLLRAFLSRDDKWRLPVNASQVDANFIRYLKHYEDKRFDRHAGVDPIALVRAVGQWLGNGRIVSGASTLTMQAARLLEPRPRTIGNKLIEMARAVQLEWHFTKDEILSIYLTLAPYGGNLEGVRSASLAWFDREPDRLTPSQAALLVALPQSPERYRPDRFPQMAAAKRNWVLARLELGGLVTAEDLSAFSSEPVPLDRSRMPFLAPRLSASLAARERGQVITTTLSRPLQSDLETLLDTEGHWQGGASIAALIVDNATREIIGYAGGTDFFGPAGQINLARSPRSPGSTLKPFIYGMAFDDLIVHPETLIEDRPMTFGDYAPQNFDRNFQGTVTVSQALRYSLNVPAVALLNEVGPVRFAAAMSDAGARFQYSRRGIAPSLPLALGGVGITLENLTMLYTGLANGGRVAPLRIRAAEQEVPPKRLISDAAAWYLADILKDSSMPDGWSQRDGFNRRHKVAFKTGTSYGFRDAWAVGYTSRYTVGVWVGRADGSPRAGAFGRNTAAPLLLQIFDLLPGLSDNDTPPPQNVLTVRHRDDLPVNMQRFQPKPFARKVVAKSIESSTSNPPVIRFPGNGVAVAMPEPGEEETIALKAIGGTWPLRWMVNGRLLPQEPDYLDTTFWRPEGEGFADIVVVDAEGRSARSQIRLIPARSLDSGSGSSSFR